MVYIPSPIVKKARYDGPEAISQSIVQPIPQSMSNVNNPVDVETAQYIANEAANRAAVEAANIAAERVAHAADEAAKKTVSGFKEQNAGHDDLNLDRELKKIFFTKMMRPSFGDILSEQIDNQMANQIAGRLIPGLFGGGGHAPQEQSVKSGVIGFLRDMLDTKFGDGLGQAIGQNATDIIRTLGRERVGQILDAYQQRMSYEGQQANDEQQRLLMQEQQRLYEEEQRRLYEEQQRLQYEKEMKELAEQEMRQQQAYEAQKSQKSQKQDINRQLIDRYETSANANIPGFFESGNIGNNNPLDLSINPNKPGTNSLDFGPNPLPLDPFMNSGPVIAINGDDDEDFILSIDPDDPVSQQQYMQYRGITGVPLDEIKRLILKEKKKLMSKSKEPEKNIEPLTAGTQITEQPESLQSLEGAQKPAENPIDTIMRIFDKLDKKMDFLEKEIMVIKSQKDSIKEAEYVDIPDVPQAAKNIQELVVLEPDLEQTSKITDTNVTNGNRDIQDIDSGPSDADIEMEKENKENEIKDKTDLQKSGLISSLDKIEPEINDIKGELKAAGEIFSLDDLEIPAENEITDLQQDNKDNPTKPEEKSEETQEEIQLEALERDIEKNIEKNIDSSDDYDVMDTFFDENLDESFKSSKTIKTEKNVEIDKDEFVNEWWPETKSDESKSNDSTSKKSNRFIIQRK